MKEICFRISLALTLLARTGLVAAGPDAGRGTLLWQQNLNGTANGLDAARSVAVDKQGNVVAAGSTENTGTFADFAVAKFDRDGTLLWQQNLNGTANGFDEAFSVAVDNQGNVVAAGSTENTGTFADFTVTKFDRDGTLLWQQTLNGTAGNSFDEAFSVAVDNDGNVVAAGFTWNTRISIDTLDFTVAKFDRYGTLLWQQNLDGTGIVFEGVRSMALDNQGNVVASSFTRNTGTSLDFTVAKFHRDGTLLWQQNLNGAAPDSQASDFAFSVAVDNQGNVVAAGVTENTGGNSSRGTPDFTVTKFDRDGTLLWQRNLNGTGAKSLDEALSVAVDNQGNVVAAGFTQNAGSSSNTLDFTVAKFDRDGTLLWQQNLNGTANIFDFAFSVAVDNHGNVVAAGFTGNTGPGENPLDFTVTKFDRDGTLLWQQNLNGTASRLSIDEALSVVVDNQGNVVAAGFTQNNGTYRDFTVAKFHR
jgi:uncharacterized delta-60 repeat protein